MDLEAEQQRIQHLVEFYYFLEQSLETTRRMFGTKFHEATFIDSLCRENNINIEEFQQVLDFIAEYAQDHC